MRAEVGSDPGVTAREETSAPALGLAKVSRVDSLGDQAVSSLRGALRRGALSPGQRLTVREIADTLDISLTPAREALTGCWRKASSTRRPIASLSCRASPRRATARFAPSASIWRGRRPGKDAPGFRRP